MLPAPSAWNVDGGGAWSVASNWDNGVPAAEGRATLGSALTATNAPATVNLDAPVSLTKLSFDNSNKYILSGVGTLTFHNTAELVVENGSHESAVPVAGTAGLNISGGGTVTLSAVNTYRGDTNIQTGALALSGSATIANSANVNVAAGGTFDVTAAISGSYTLDNQTLTVDGDVLGNVITTNGATVHVNSSTSLHGDLGAQSNSLVAGAGRVTGDLTAESGSVVRVGGEGLTFGESRIAIDDFESYALGNVRDVASPPWTAHGGSPGTQYADIEDDAGNQVLTYGWAGDARGTSRDMPDDTIIGDDQVATFFFRFNSRTDDPDHHFGLAGTVDTTADAECNDYETQVFLIDDPDATGTYMLAARSGSRNSAGLATDLATGV